MNKFKIEIQTPEQIKERMRQAEMESLRAENARLTEENARAQSVIDYGMMMGVIPDPEMEEE